MSNKRYKKNEKKNQKRKKMQTVKVDFLPLRNGDCLCLKNESMPIIINKSEALELLMSIDMASESGQIKNVERGILSREESTIAGMFVQFQEAC